MYTPVSYTHLDVYKRQVKHTHTEKYALIKDACHSLVQFVEPLKVIQ